jgi:hypothetical protein
LHSSLSLFAESGDVAGQNWEQEKLTIDTYINVSLSPYIIKYLRSKSEMQHE